MRKAIELLTGKAVSGGARCKTTVSLVHSGRGCQSSKGLNGERSTEKQGPERGREYFWRQLEGWRGKPEGKRGWPRIYKYLAST